MMNPFDDDEIYKGYLQGGGLSYPGLQDVFERSFFTVADRELRAIALQTYSRLPDREMHCARVQRALTQLEERSLNWLHFPQKTAMRNQRRTLREFIGDVRGIVPPVSYAADKIVQNYEHVTEEGWTLAAIFFNSLKIRLDSCLAGARDIFRHGTIITRSAQKLGAFGVVVRDDIGIHLLGMQGMTTYNEGLLQDTRRIAEQVMDAGEVNKFIERFAALMSAIDGFAKANTGNYHQDSANRRMMLEGIVRIVPSIVNTIKRLGDKMEERKIDLPPDLTGTADLLPYIGYNLDQIRERRPRRPPGPNPDQPRL